MRNYFDAGDWLPCNEEANSQVKKREKTKTLAIAGSRCQAGGQEGEGPQHRTKAGTRVGLSARAEAMEEVGPQVEKPAKAGGWARERGGESTNKLAGLFFPLFLLFTAGGSRWLQ